jgi:hypothetical protein
MTLCAVVAFVALLTIFGSCKKAVQQLQENYVTSLMTNGHWYVAQYLEKSNDVTTDFTGFEFQFYSDGKVDGLKGGSATKGVWAADISALTITSSFPSAGAPLAKLNSTWKFKDSAPSYVKAEATINGLPCFLFLKKVP